jgi:signal transduction histidine kinase
MNLLGVARSRTLVLALALAAIVIMIAISEASYWRMVALLDDVDAEYASGLARLRLALWQDRVAIVLLGAISLAVLAVLLRLGLAQQGRQTLQKSLQMDQQVLAQAVNERLEAEVSRRTQQLTELTHHLQTAREDERQRLAHDLHDELGALLTSAKLDAARIRSRLGTTAPEARERLAHLVQTLDQVIEPKRTITENLRPSALRHLGLPATLEILGREFGESSGLSVHCELAAVPLTPAAELVIYRLVQEAINNISKYAAAREVWLDLRERDGQAVVSVRDDGVGFDVEASSRAGHGLVGMRFRAEAERGRLTVMSVVGQGTCIELTLPTVA